MTRWFASQPQPASPADSVGEVIVSLMLRYVELLLFLAPFILFAMWRITGSVRGLSSRVVAASFVLLGVLLGALLWFQWEGALPSGSTYVPATLHEGRIVPGHGAPP